LILDTRIKEEEKITEPDMTIKLIYADICPTKFILMDFSCFD